MVGNWNGLPRELVTAPSCWSLRCIARICVVLCGDRSWIWSSLCIPSNSENSMVLWLYDSILFPFTSDGFNQGIFISTSAFHPSRSGCAFEMMFSYLAKTFQECVQRASPTWHLQRYLRTLVHECNSGSQEFWGLFLPLALIASGGIQQVSDLLKDNVSLKYSARLPLLRDRRECHLRMCHLTLNKCV